MAAEIIVETCYNFCMENFSSPPAAAQTPPTSSAPYVPLSWQAAEYSHTPKTADWFWSVGIIALAIAAAAIFFSNLLLAILVIIGAFSLMLFAARPPKTIEIAIDKDGIKIDKYRYPFASLESFWINQDGRTPKLLITTKKTFAPHIALSIENVPTEKIRGRLSQSLKEEEQHESVIDLAMEMFGF